MILTITEISNENHVSRNSGEITHHAAMPNHAVNLGPITHHADYLGPITRHGKLFPTSVHYPIPLPLASSVGANMRRSSPTVRSVLVEDICLTSSHLE